MNPKKKGAHGGRRPGAGRKKKSVTHAGVVVAAEKRCADRLPKTIGTLEQLADGGTSRSEEKWVAAGQIYVKRPLLDKDGNPVLDVRGKPAIAEQLAFPELPPDELVLVETKVVTMPPDFRAAEYLANRVMGRPTERHEVTGEDGAPFKVYVNLDVDRI